MKQFVLTRAAYGPAWDIEANRRRLAVSQGITIASMAAQTYRDWTWIVAVDKADPLKAERKDAFRSAGVPVRFVEVSSTTDSRDAAAWDAYFANWRRWIGKRDVIVAQTRLDDDDALAPWMMHRVADLAPTISATTAFVFPMGIRVWDGRYSMVVHESNAMHTLVTPPGSDLVVYDYKHRLVRRHARYKKIRPKSFNDVAWLWARHPDTISGHRQASIPIDDRVRRLFPVDWSLFGEPATVRSLTTGQVRFR